MGPVLFAEKGSNVLTIYNGAVRYLERLNPSAAASLREGLEETLTLHRLGVTGLLKKTLLTTNPNSLLSCSKNLLTVICE